MRGARRIGFRFRLLTTPSQHTGARINGAWKTLSTRAVNTDAAEPLIRSARTYAKNAGALIVPSSAYHSDAAGGEVFVAPSEPDDTIQDFLRPPIAAWPVFEGVSAPSTGD